MTHTMLQFSSGADGIASNKVTKSYDQHPMYPLTEIGIGCEVEPVLPGQDTHVRTTKTCYHSYTFT